MNEFLNSLKSKGFGNKDRAAKSTPPTLVGSTSSTDLPVLAEIEITGTQLHKIAGGECMTLSEGALGVRFLLHNSFKSKYSNYVVNQFKMQVVALGKENVMKKEDIAVKTKVRTVTREKVVKAKKPEAKAVAQAKLGNEECY